MCAQKLTNKSKMFLRLLPDPIILIIMVLKNCISVWCALMVFTCSWKSKTYVVTCYHVCESWKCTIELSIDGWLISPSTTRNNETLTIWSLTDTKTRSTFAWCLRKKGRRWFVYIFFAPWNKAKINADEQLPNGKAIIPF